MFGNPMEIALLVGAAVLLFGADKLPKLARSAGQAKKEYMVGQAEADIAAEEARETARMRADASRTNPTGTTNGVGMSTPAPEPGSGTTTAPTTSINDR